MTKPTKICAGRITSPFGVRRDPINKLWREHNGVDISAVVGSPVYSPCDGYVAALFSNAVGGKTLILMDDDGTHRFAFCHLSGFEVKMGDRVAKADLVAKTGNTGRTTGPHLHFSVMTGGKVENGMYVGGQYIDPMPFLEL